MNTYQKFHSILVSLFNDVMDVEQKAIITDEFKDLTNNDMHVIEAIGIGEEKNMSSIAKAMRVTTGTLTISMNNLVKKGYVSRQRSEADRRVVYIRLTQKGKKAYQHHARFHKEMTEAMIREIKPDETEVLLRALTNLKDFIDQYKKE